METSKQIPVTNTHQNPLISVIIPIYNLEPFIDRCIKSIISQTYSNIEIVLVDDGSSDLSGTIIDSYARKYPNKVVVLHQENSGVTNARINGIKMSKGEWIGLVDGDDVIESDMYERLIRNALDYDADISHCGYQTIVNEGERIHYFYNTGKKFTQDHNKGLEDLILGKIVEPGLWNKLFKRELWEELIEKKEYDSSIKINEDLMLNFLLFNYSNKSVFEDFCPYHYMSRTNSASRSEFSLFRALDPIKVRKWILQRVESNLEPLVWRKYLVVNCNAYQSLFFRKQYKSEALIIKRTILNNFSKKKYLTGKERRKMYFIIFVPHLYRCIYSIYSKYLQKKDYE